MILNRLISFSLVITIGFLLMVSLVVSALMDLLNQRLQRYFPVDSYYIFYALNILLIFVVISFLFATIFKILPDGKLKWKNVMSGSIFTALLFMIGKFGLSYYIGQSHIGSSYGAAGSIIIILVWVYYSSMILYFGAVFTQVYARIYGQKLVPNSYAVLVEQIQIEKEISDNSRKVPAEAGQN